MAIKKMNAKGKERKKDAFLTSLRMTYEGLFSRMSGKARYRGELKVYFQALMEALVSNLKRLITILAEPIPITSAEICLGSELFELIPKLFPEIRATHNPAPVVSASLSSAGPTKLGARRVL